MKKAGLILLAILYLLSNLSFSINLHYCSGKLKQIQLFANEEHHSCCKVKHGKKDCCKDKKFSVKKSSVEVSPMVCKPELLQIAALPVNGDFKLQPIPVTENTNDNYVFGIRPPPDIGVPIFILNRTLLI